ncbi:hypothetical protein E8M24_30825 [Bacillus thuringiensis]|uniref:Uncharacterized protein n=1 Tax=Bacillus cereus TIAC219 TaxID=718222 RepID=A0ABC9SPS1_BACCE|nr:MULTISPECIES: hypothetical protein [Bacillus cereus group]EJP82102.1 hypothetical protein IC1_06028 [Bacillus cereus VD022]EOQ57517.1 hypothetical protein IAY_06498 [Bacillus cereus TIAC219]KAB5628322.1 hypothetical protein E8M24_30825 [Bacillus thuringiensis]HDR5271595.1 hypothetical protein [Bacillus thuringiensis]
MLKKKLGKLGVGALALGVMIPSTAAFAEESTPASAVNYEQNNVASEVQNQELSVEVYDKNDNLVKVYTKEEIEAFNAQFAANPTAAFQYINNVSPLALNSTSFGKAQFSSSLWIRGGATFKKPQSVAVESPGNTYGLGIYVYHDGSQEGRYKVNGTFTGGLNIPIGHLTKDYNYYSLQLANMSEKGGTITLSGGTVFHQ